MNLQSSGLDCIQPFTLLQDLYLQGNNIDDLSDSLLYCGNLKCLFLSYNQLTLKGCSESFAGLTSLRVLDLSHNRIDQVPEQNAALPKTLRILDLVGNPYRGEEATSSISEDERELVDSLRFLNKFNGADVLQRLSNSSSSSGDVDMMMMSITIPLDNDDGTSSGKEVELPFSRNSDLLSIADQFCQEYDIEGERSRRELIVMMRREARGLGVIMIGNRQNEIERKKVVEEKQGDDEEEKEEAADPFETQTNRAFDAVQSFMTEFGDQTHHSNANDEEAKEDNKPISAFDEAFKSIKAQSQKVRETAVKKREASDSEISDKALAEARLKLEARVAKMKDERAKEKALKAEGGETTAMWAKARNDELRISTPRAEVAEHVIEEKEEESKFIENLEDEGKDGELGDNFQERDVRQKPIDEDLSYDDEMEYGDDDDEEGAFSTGDFRSEMEEMDDELRAFERKINAGVTTVGAVKVGSLDKVGKRSGGKENVAEEEKEDIKVERPAPKTKIGGGGGSSGRRK
jgi:hypothetical protein